MKKVFLVLSIATFALFAVAKEKKSAKSQESPHAFGLRVGLTTPTYLGGNDLPSGFSKGVTTGFIAGLIYSYYFSEILSIQPELLFIQGGTSLKLENTFLGNKVTSTSNSNWGYVQVPVLLKARFGSDAFKFTVHAGPYIGFATGGKTTLKNEGYGSPTDGETSSDIKVEKGGLAAIDFGAAVGVGVNIQAGPGQVIVDLRANIGLTDINNLDPTPSGYKATTNLIPSLSVGYLLPLGN